MAERYWLMKSEPDVFSIDDLQRQRVDYWDGVRNYQARNLMRDQMKVGDLVLFYHSNAKPPGVAGVARVAREAYPDHTAQDPASKYYDASSSPDDPRWVMVDIEFVEKFPALVPLATLQETPGLEDMMVTKRGMRLSVQPVKLDEWEIVTRLGRTMPPAPAAQSKPGTVTRKTAAKKAATVTRKTAAKKAATVTRKTAGAGKKAATVTRKAAGAGKKAASKKAATATAKTTDRKRART
jgi:predicted RNA-binding protein with PUA-like domain